MYSNRLLPEPRNEELVVPQPESQPVAYRPAYFESSGYAETEADDIGQILEYVRVLFKRKWFILSAGVSCFFLAVVISLLQTPLYKAHASLEIEANHEKSLNEEGLSCQ